MKFKSLPVTSLEDATVDFEQLSTRAILDSTPTSFLQLLTAQTLTMAFGTATMTFSATTAANLTVAHGLPRTPKVVVATAIDAVENMYVQEFQAPDATNIYLHGVLSVAATGTRQIHWIAIG